MIVGILYCWWSLIVFVCFCCFWLCVDVVMFIYFGLRGWFWKGKVQALWFAGKGWHCTHEISAKTNYCRDFLGLGVPLSRFGEMMSVFLCSFVRSVYLCCDQCQDCISLCALHLIIDACVKRTATTSYDDLRCSCATFSPTFSFILVSYLVNLM